MKSLKESHNVYVWWKEIPMSKKKEYLSLHYATPDEMNQIITGINSDEKIQPFVSGKQLIGLSHSEMSGVILSELANPKWLWSNFDNELFKEEVNLLCENLI